MEMLRSNSHCVPESLRVTYPREAFQYLPTCRVGLTAFLTMLIPALCGHSEQGCDVHNQASCPRDLSVLSKPLQTSPVSVTVSSKEGLSFPQLCPLWGHWISVSPCWTRPPGKEQSPQSLLPESSRVRGPAGPRSLGDIK